MRCIPSNSTESKCLLCNENTDKCTVYKFAPAILPVTVLFVSAPAKDIINIVVDGVVCNYRLKGIVYYADHHFTARFIDSTNTVWFNDGMIQGRAAMMEGSSDSIAFSTDKCNRLPDTYIYAGQDTV
ncbi:hypothetical protein ARMGADRAFT_936699 [Armillaria gallica]|uniref:Uncharacterized protein n=1 Tax=Armillaria gallica TaxID=47427 RepID=A0A2H3DLL1_ARMGA|nr:hypothetical protein ARMGADRAFT_936699 [Armillaria gallica]